MPKKNYELIGHTADICIRVKASSLPGLFKNAGLAIFDIAAEKQNTKKPRLKTITITQKADNLDELFINWLNELLSLSSAKELIFTGFQMEKLDETSLKAKAFASPAENYRINTEVKAATYHELKIEKKGPAWSAQVILDV